MTKQARENSNHFRTNPHMHSCKLHMLKNEIQVHIYVKTRVRKEV